MKALEKIIKDATPVTIELSSPYKGLTSIYGNILSISTENHSLLVYVSDFKVVEHFQLTKIESIVAGKHTFSFIFIKDS